VLHCCIVRKEYAVRLVVISGILLMGTLFFAPWYDRVFLIGFEVTRTAVEPPQGWLAVLAWLTTGALLLEVVVTRLSTTGLPEVAVSWVRIQLVQAAAVFVLVLVKFAVTGQYAWGSWVGLVLSAVFAYSVWAAAGQPTPADWREMRAR
jgi:O-antigen/teichoic acid export membrane protein